MTIERRLYRFADGVIPGDYDKEDDRIVCDSLDAADVVSSRSTADDVTHYPVLDIDIPARLVPSETPGHTHLFIDVPMTWRQLEQLIDVLESVGIIESGYAAASRRREATFVATRPWKAFDLVVDAPYDDGRLWCPMCKLDPGTVTGENESAPWDCENCGARWNAKGQRGRRGRDAPVAPRKYSGAGLVDRAMGWD